MYVADSSILPRYAPVPGMGSCSLSACAQSSGVGAWDFLVSPAASAARMAKNPSCRGCGGLGQDINMGPAMGVAGVGLAILAVGVVLTGFLSYKAGKAMAPSSGKQKTWGWIGVPVGLFTGAPGLGIMGWISTAKGR